MIDSIFEEIRAERRRQDEKWGEQNYPMLGYLLDDSALSSPSIPALKSTLEIARRRWETGKAGWFDILIEEACEAFLETEPEKQRDEMIQVAAVAVNIIEYLDRRIGSL